MINFKEFLKEETEKGIKGQKVTGEPRNLTGDESGKNAATPEMKRENENKVAACNATIKSGLNKVNENVLKAKDLGASVDFTKAKEILNAIIDGSQEALSGLGTKENLVTKNAKKV